MPQAGARQIEFDDYDLPDEARRESLMGLGNGVLFVRACAPEAAFARRAADRAQHYAGLYFAGGYNRAGRFINGEAVQITSLVNLPDPFALSFRPEGAHDWFALDDVQLLHYRHRLDLDAGVAEREMRVRDDAGRETLLHETRCVSLVDADAVLLHWRLVPCNWSGALELRSLLRTTAANAKLARTRAYEGRHLEVQPVPATGGGVAVCANTTDGTRRFRIESRLSCVVDAGGGDAQPVAIRVEVDKPRQALAQHARVRAVQGQALDIELQVHVRADEAAGRATAVERAALLASQRQAWRALWDRLEFDTPGDDTLARSARAGAFHLLQAASPLTSERDTGLPARGWQEGYFGHVFWDELLAFPFYDLRFPAISRALLAYRHRRLGAARTAALRSGWRGAMFPWRSATTGEEETPAFQWIPPARQWKPDHTHLQHHIGSAIAFNAWRHHLATGDARLLAGETGELLIEIARFWASRVHKNEDGRYDILGVIGPDEYHDAWPGAEQPGLDNNSYTNLMAAETLRCASELPRHMEACDWLRLCHQCDVRAGEVDGWDQVSRRLRVCLIGDGVLAQFDGFDRLEPAERAPLPPDGQHEREDWWLLARGDDVNRYQITKQADVLMLFYLLGVDATRALLDRLGVPLSAGWHERTVRHYLDRVSHESSLSHVVCAGALAEIDTAESWHYYRQALATDLERKPEGSTHEGVHLGAMAGAWDVLQRFYLGLWPQSDGLLLRPHLPDGLDDVRMALQWHGQRIGVRLSGSALTLRHEDGGQALVLRHAGEMLRLEPGREVAVWVR